MTVKEVNIPQIKFPKAFVVEVANTKIQSSENNSASLADIAKWVEYGTSKMEEFAPIRKSWIELIGTTKFNSSLARDFDKQNFQPTADLIKNNVRQFILDKKVRDIKLSTKKSRWNKLSTNQKKRAGDKQTFNADITPLVVNGTLLKAYQCYPVFKNDKNDK